MVLRSTAASGAAFHELSSRKGAAAPPGALSPATPRRQKRRCRRRFAGATVRLVVACAAASASVALRPLDTSDLPVTLLEVAGTSTWRGAPSASLLDTRTSSEREVGELKNSLGKHVEMSESDVARTRTAELLRFVTAYNRPLEALVDVTPFSPLLRRAADEHGKLVFYAFVGTWASNETSTVIFNTDKRTCVEQPLSLAGNGFNLQAELVFWPRTGFADTRPREALSLLQSGLSGEVIGGVSVLEGRVAEDKRSVIIEKRGRVDKDDFSNGESTRSLDVNGSHVYSCDNGKDDLLKAMKMYTKLDQVREEARQYGARAAVKRSLEVYKDLVSTALLEVQVVSAQAPDGTVEAVYESKPDVEAAQLASAAAASKTGVNLEPGLPVYFSKDVMEESGSGPQSRSLKPIGRVVEAARGKLKLRLNVQCHDARQLLIPRSAEVTRHAASLAHSFAQEALKVRWSEQSGDEERAAPPEDVLYTHGNSFKSGKVLGITMPLYHGRIVGQGDSTEGGKTSALLATESGAKNREAEANASREFRVALLGTHAPRKSLGEIADEYDLDHDEFDEFTSDPKASKNDVVQNNTDNPLLAFANILRRLSSRAEEDDDLAKTIAKPMQKALDLITSGGSARSLRHSSGDRASGPADDDPGADAAAAAESRREPRREQRRVQVPTTPESIFRQSVAAREARRTRRERERRERQKASADALPPQPPALPPAEAADGEAASGLPQDAKLGEVVRKELMREQAKSGPPANQADFDARLGAGLRSILRRLWHGPSREQASEAAPEPPPQPQQEFEPQQPHPRAQPQQPRQPWKTFRTTEALRQLRATLARLAGGGSAAEAAPPAQQAPAFEPRGHVTSVVEVESGAGAGAGLQVTRQAVAAAAVTAEATASVGAVAGESAASDEAESTVRAGARVCLVLGRRSGHIVQRDFATPHLRNGDRALLHFTSTGHGWSGSSHQCGEFCEMVYRLRMDDHEPIDVSLFRHDCEENPVSPQDGTYNLNRNGWCPGSVSPGIYLDVTHWLLPRRHQTKVSVEVLVYKKDTEQYEPYLNYGPLYGGDSAYVNMGMNLFVYDRDAVEAIQAQPAPLSLAEKALRDGTSAPLFGKVMSDAAEAADSDSAAAAASARERAKDAGASNGRRHRRAAAAPSEAQERLPSGGGVDLVRKAPWFNYNSATSGPPSASVTGKQAWPMRLFSGALMQSQTRARLSRRVDEALPPEWGQVALHLKIVQPQGQDFDYWDRLGSVGLVLPAEMDPSVSVS